MRYGGSGVGRPLLVDSGRPTPLPPYLILPRPLYFVLTTLEVSVPLYYYNT
jgi:hypothetical protein